MINVETGKVKFSELRRTDVPRRMTEREHRWLGHLEVNAQYCPAEVHEVMGSRPTLVNGVFLLLRRSLYLGGCCYPSILQCSPNSTHHWEFISQPFASLISTFPSFHPVICIIPFFFLSHLQFHYTYMHFC